MFSVFESLQRSSYTWGYDVGVVGGGEGGWSGILWFRSFQAVIYGDMIWGGGGAGTFWFRSFRAVNCVDMVWGRVRRGSTSVIDKCSKLGSENNSLMLHWWITLTFVTSAEVQYSLSLVPLSYTVDTCTTFVPYVHMWVDLCNTPVFFFSNPLPSQKTSHVAFPNFLYDEEFWGTTYVFSACIFWLTFNNLLSQRWDGKRLKTSQGEALIYSLVCFFLPTSPPFFVLTRLHFGGKHFLE